MNKLTAKKCAWLVRQLKSTEAMSGELSIADQYKLQALEIALPVLEQQERKQLIQNQEGLTEADRYKIPSMPEMVTAQDMRETLNVAMFEEEAQAAANGFNQCLMECAPIYEAALRKSRCIDECLKELDAMQESINHTHRRRTFWRERAEAAEKKLAALEQQEKASGKHQEGE